jgi:hypothetical protein
MEIGDANAVVVIVGVVVEIVTGNDDIHNCLLAVVAIGGSTDMGTATTIGMGVYCRRGVIADVVGVARGDTSSIADGAFVEVDTKA